AGATVHHLPKRDGPPADGARFERFLEQEALTDSSGSVELAPFAGEQVLWAVRGELRSIPWQGPTPSSPVVLVMGETFTVGGSVLYPDRVEWKPDYEGERRIMVSGFARGFWRPLVRVRDVEEGTWGPIAVPLEGVSRLRVRLEGAPITPIEEEFD